MDVYIDKTGLLRFLKQWIKGIRKDNDTGDYSVHNISFENMCIYNILLEQFIKPSFTFTQKDDGAVDIENIGMDGNIEDYRSLFFCQDLEEEWKDLDEQEKEELMKEINVFWRRTKENFKFHEASRFYDESSISIVNNEKQSAGKNPKSKIDLSDILKGLKERFFVSKMSMNNTFYTREYQDWKEISLSLKNDKDIVIVDPYFFQSKGVAFGENEKSFIRAIYEDIETINTPKNIVIIYKNCVCSEWLQYFSSKIKEAIDCNITFIGVTDRHVLHDRFIISNYRLVFSGHSFAQFFNEGCFCANGSIGLSVGSVADNSNEHVMYSAFHYLQEEILDKEKSCWIYGDGISNILEIPSARRWNDVVEAKSKNVIEDYPYGIEIKIEWDDNDKCFHGGEHISFDNLNREEKQDYKGNQFVGRKVRACNIKPNRDYPIHSKYRWKAFAYILD